MSSTGSGAQRQYENGSWYPTPPIKAPWDVRWCCYHDWTPHRHDSGETSPIDWDCLCCGATTENAARPPSEWHWRRWIAEQVTQYGRALRRNR